MKEKVSPAIAGAIIVAVVAVLGFVIFRGVNPDKSISQQMPENLKEKAERMMKGSSSGAGVPSGVTPPSSGSSRRPPMSATGSGQ